MGRLRRGEFTLSSRRRGGRLSSRERIGASFVSTCREHFRVLQGVELEKIDYEAFGEIREGVALP